MFLTETLIGEAIGLLPLDERFYTVYFAAFPIARFDSHRLRIVPRLEAKDFSGAGAREGEVSLPLHPIPSKQQKKKCQGCARSKVSDMSPAAHGEKKSGHRKAVFS